MKDSNLSDTELRGTPRKPDSYVVKVVQGGEQLVGTAKHVASGREIPFASAQALVEILQTESSIRKVEENDHEI